MPLVDQIAVERAVDKMSTSAGDFADALYGIVDNLEKNAALIIKKTSFDLFERIKKRTPFRTGRARTGWGITVGTVPEDEKGQIDLSGYTLDDILWIYNNVHYIIYLEAGSSMQAPNGMVALSMTEYAEFFRQATEDLGYDTI